MEPPPFSDGHIHLVFGRIYFLLGYKAQAKSTLFEQEIAGPYISLQVLDGGLVGVKVTGTSNITSSLYQEKLDGIAQYHVRTFSQNIFNEILFCPALDFIHGHRLHQISPQFFIHTQDKITSDNPFNGNKSSNPEQFLPLFPFHLGRMQ